MVIKAGAAGKIGKSVMRELFKDNNIVSSGFVHLKTKAAAIAYLQSQRF